jgi:hypothetical protein
MEVSDDGILRLGNELHPAKAPSVFLGFGFGFEESSLFIYGTVSGEDVSGLSDELELVVLVGLCVLSVICVPSGTCTSLS